MTNQSFEALSESPRGSRVGEGAHLRRPVSSGEPLRSRKPESRGGPEWPRGMRLSVVYGGVPPPPAGVTPTLGVVLAKELEADFVEGGGLSMGACGRRRMRLRLSRVSIMKPAAAGGTRVSSVPVVIRVGTRRSGGRACVMTANRLGLATEADGAGFKQVVDRSLYPRLDESGWSAGLAAEQPGQGKWVNPWHVPCLRAGSCRSRGGRSRLLRGSCSVAAG